MNFNRADVKAAPTLEIPAGCRNPRAGVSAVTGLWRLYSGVPIGDESGAFDQDCG
jgi:hypothetical protein